jgi:hypothetical protein
MKKKWRVAFYSHEREIDSVEIEATDKEIGKLAGDKFEELKASQPIDDYVVMEKVS